MLESVGHNGYGEWNMNSVLQLVEYAVKHHLIEETDRTYAVNSVLGVMNCDALPELDLPQDASLPELLDSVTHYALADAGPVERDLFDTKIMGVLTPRPSQVIRQFQSLYSENAKVATDWYYRFSIDTNYIRMDRIRKNEQWKVATQYGDLDISINLSKPEKDPKAIAAARNMKQSSYPQCLLCAENVGYAGRLNHPARQNHRIIPITINDTPWYLQYSPYVYYNEHCICFNAEHTPMKIDKACFRKLLDFVRQFPHYFVGSNADLPIVGGSILAHDHFQGGRCTFPMEKAPVEEQIEFSGYEDIRAGIVKWPLSVIRLTGPDAERLAELADRILEKWRGYSDESAAVLAQTDDIPHNTVTPIARRRDSNYELDLVLRNNLTSDEFPDGIYHPHKEIHHIKKENIGLIEVMGLAILPARLKQELAAVADCLVQGTDLRSSELTLAHADWAEVLRRKYQFTSENVMTILRDEAGAVFLQGLEHAGVFKRTPEGRMAFLRFLRSVVTK